MEAHSLTNLSCFVRRRQFRQRCQWGRCKWPHLGAHLPQFHLDHRNTRQPKQEREKNTREVIDRRNLKRQKLTNARVYLVRIARDGREICINVLVFWNRSVVRITVILSIRSQGGLCIITIRITLFRLGRWV